MHKSLLLSICLIAFAFSQTEIPPPTDIANFTKKTFPDDTMYINKSIEATGTPYLYHTQNIGDFDGDQSEEVYLTWYKGDATRTSTLKTTGVQSVNYWDYIYQHGVYSVKKKTYILTSPFNVLFNNVNSSPWPGTVLTGDFTGDGCIDFLIGTKVYSTSTPIVKKKE
jgi:hypothetical protein